MGRNSSPKFISAARALSAVGSKSSAANQTLSTISPLPSQTTSERERRRRPEPWRRGRLARRRARAVSPARRSVELAGLRRAHGRRTGCLFSSAAPDLDPMRPHASTSPAIRRGGDLRQGCHGRALKVDFFPHRGDKFLNLLLFCTLKS
jgi:hypothetical protein